MSGRMDALPTGTVTFLLTDVEGSTRLWEERPDEMRGAVRRHEEIIAAAVARHHGVVVKSRGEGDSLFTVFASGADAVRAALDLQRELHAEPWPEGMPMRVRAALHSGEAELRGGDYFGAAVNRTARLRAIAHGGQTIMSQATAELAADGLPAGAELRDLGLHRLRDVARPERVFQLDDPDVPRDFPPLRSLEARLHNLPTQRTSFIGRGRELAEVRRLLREGRLVTLTGVGGCGKTRLAIHAAAKSATDFPDGVYFVDLAPVSEAESLDAAVASALGISFGPFPGGAGSTRAEIRAFLSSRRALVVLDNCEHLLDACAEIADDLVAACPSLVILATSREALGVEGERAFPVPSLPTGEEGDSAETDSVRLFGDRATAVRPDFALGRDTIDAVAEICRRLDGIPLAIELAAARVGHLSPRQIAERLGDRFRLLTGARRRVQRHQTLQATLDWSHELLPEADRTLLRRLAVFRATFTLEAAEAVCGGDDLDATGIVDLLGSLVAKSLLSLQEEEGTARYRMLETVRLYAEDRLVEAGEAEHLRSAHRDYVLRLVETFSLDGVIEDWNVNTAIGDLYDDTRAAIEWSAAEGRLDLVARILVRTYFSWAFRGALEESRRWFDAILEREEHLEPELHLACVANASLVAMLQMDGERREILSRRAIVAAGGTPSVWLALALFARAGLIAFSDLDEALRIAEEGVRVSRAVSSSARAALLAMRGDIHLLHGDLGNAAASYTEAADGWDPARHYWGPLWGRFGLSLAAHLAGDDARALAIAEDIDARLGDQMRYGAGLMILSCLALARAGIGDDAGARDALRRAIESYRRTHMPAAFNFILGAYGAIAVHEEQYERASRLLGASGGMTRWPSGYAIYRHYVARVREHLDPATARRCRDEGRAMTLEQAIAHALE